MTCEDWGAESIPQLSLAAADTMIATSHHNTPVYCQEAERTIQYFLLNNGSYNTICPNKTIVKVRLMSLLWCMLCDELIAHQADYQRVKVKDNGLEEIERGEIINIQEYINICPWPIFNLKKWMKCWGETMMIVRLYL